MVTGHDIGVDVEADGNISVQLALIGGGEPTSFLDDNATLMAASLAGSDDELYRTVEEIGGPESAVLLRVAVTLSGNETNAEIAGALIKLGRDPAVRATALVMKENGIEVSRALLVAGRPQGRELGIRLRTSSTALIDGVRGQGQLTREVLHAAAQTSWSNSASAARTAGDQAKSVVNAATQRAAPLLQQGSASARNSVDRSAAAIRSGTQDAAIAMAANAAAIRQRSGEANEQAAIAARNVEMNAQRQAAAARAVAERQADAARAAAARQAAAIRASAAQVGGNLRSAFGKLRPPR
jgi:hypothetical protein